MSARSNSVAKVTFQILLLGGQVFSGKEAKDLCAFLTARKQRMGSKENGSVHIMVDSQECGLCAVTTAVEILLSLFPRLLPHGKQNPATPNDQHVLLLESRADVC